jgi:hypothetical protein
MVADFADSMVESAIRCGRCYIPLHVGTQELLNHYLDDARHAADIEGALFRPVSNNRIGKLGDTITPDGVYKLVRRFMRWPSVSRSAPTCCLSCPSISP